MEAADARNDMLQRRETKILSHDDGNIFPEKKKKNVTHVVDWTYSCAGWECVSERYQRVEWFSSRCRNYVASPQRDELVEMFDDSRLRGAIPVPHCHTQSLSMNGRWGCWCLVKKYYFTILVLTVNNSQYVGFLIYSTLNALFVIHTNPHGPSDSGLRKTGKVINLWHKSACDAFVLLADYVTR